MADDASCPRCSRAGPAQRDLRGLLAALTLVFVFGLAFAQLLSGSEDGATLPPWPPTVLALVLNSYYMTKGAERHAQALTRRAGFARSAEDVPGE